MNVLVGNTKGGVGKSTVAIQLAVARAELGRKVWVIDGDPQRTTAIAMQIRADGGTLPFIAVSTLSEGKELRTQVLGQRERFDDIVIDAGGKDSSALRAALMVADTLLVPFRPRSFDVWALENIEALVKQAGETRDGLRAVTFLNAADASGRDNTDAAEAVAGYPELEHLATSLAARKAFAEASGKGASVIGGKDLKASAEMRALLDAVFTSK